jgi:hypothetical protein
MKKVILSAIVVLAAAQANAIGLTQTAVASTVLPTATISASISGVQKEVLYKDGVEFVMQSQENTEAQPSVALREQLNIYASKNPTNETALQLTKRLLKVEIANDRALSKK